MTDTTLGMIGLGRMGGNMVRRLRRADFPVLGYNRSPEISHQLAHETGMQVAASIEELVTTLKPPRIVWSMLPSGSVTESVVQQLFGLLTPGDLLIDGANSWYKDSQRRAATATEAGLQYLDVGVSGGVWGLDAGYALMLGGSKTAVTQIIEIVRVLAPTPDKGWIHCGPNGSGHFVKMIHNGIEYGMMQAYAEGFALMHAREDFSINLAEVAEAWRHGSVVRSWLLDLTADFLAKDQQLESVVPYVADSGEGRWTALEAVEQGVPAPVMSLALMMRFSSQKNGDYAHKLLAMMRNSFGGHAVSEE